MFIRRCLPYMMQSTSVFVVCIFQTSLLRSLKPTERVVKYMEKLDSNPEAEAEEERKKQEAKEMEFDAFGF